MELLRYINKMVENIKEKKNQFDEILKRLDKIEKDLSDMKEDIFEEIHDKFEDLKEDLSEESSLGIDKKIDDIADDVADIKGMVGARGVPRGF